MVSSIRFFTLLLSSLSFSAAQQYAGEEIPNSLPPTPGSTITYFNVHDRSGANTTLTNYFSYPNGAKQDESKVQRVIIVLHGLNRDPATYFSTMWAAINDAKAINPDVSEETVAIMAPYFPSGDDKNYGYPFDAGKPAGEGSTSSALVWKGSQWASGHNNQYPYEQQTVSAYDALDQIIKYFDNKFLYPNVHQIVIAGHSLGAQMVQRYAAVGKPQILLTPVVYWVGNPSTFLWLDDSRPESIEGCNDYNDWKEGLDNYDPDYESLAVKTWRFGTIRLRYEGRSIAYARGMNDFGGQTDGCSATTTGKDRSERFLNFMAAFPPGRDDTVDYYEGIGHSAPEMFAKEPGLYRLFLDNFSGDGKRHADFGARQVDGDSPSPNDKTCVLGVCL